MDRIPILKMEDFLVTSIQIPLHDRLALHFQNDVLLKIEETNAKGLIIDITGIDVVDSFITRVISEIALMANAMGVKTVLVGLQPAIAITLVEFGMKLEGIHTALDLEKGLNFLRKQAERKDEGEGDPDKR
ncbi:MAG: STAS domain-containing protein [Candidatus Syntropharchaeia archaeon]